jgi:hypothetical protein
MTPQNPAALLNQTVSNAEREFEGVSLWWVVLVLGVLVTAWYSFKSR